jgi:hypothetical protein
MIELNWVALEFGFSQQQRTSRCSAFRPLRKLEKVVLLMVLAVLPASAQPEGQVGPPGNWSRSGTITALAPTGDRRCRLSFCWYLQDFWRSSNFAKTAYDSYKILLSGRRGSRTLSKSTTLLPRSKARRNLLMFMLALSLDGF